MERGFMGFSPFGSGFGIMSSIMPIIVGIGFSLICGIIIVTVVRSGTQCIKNNNSPVLTIAMKIVTKRIAVSRHQHHHGGDMTMDHQTSSTTYYATFESENGDRMELRVPDKEYGMLVEGDMGSLTYQGTRYKSFVRDRA
jgi:hypothetical protein